MVSIIISQKDTIKMPFYMPLLIQKNAHYFNFAAESYDLYFSLRNINLISFKLLKLLIFSEW